MKAIVCDLRRALAGRWFWAALLATTAALYLSWHPTELQPRFDVIEIYAPQGTQTANPEINHLEDAFQ